MDACDARRVWDRKMSVGGVGMRVIAVFLVLLAASRPGPVRSQDCASSRRPLSHARTPDFKQLPYSFQYI